MGASLPPGDPVGPPHRGVTTAWHRPPVATRGRRVPLATATPQRPDSPRPLPAVGWAHGPGVVRRHPDVQRAGGAAPARGSGCAPARRDGRRPTRSSPSTTAARDLTAALLQRHHREWPALRVVRLRANAGHQAAISAGLVERPRRLRRDARRRPAGPARGHPADARGRPQRRRRRRLRRAQRPLQRHVVQAGVGPGVLPPHPLMSQTTAPRRRRRLPAHVAGHGRRRQQPARAQPGAALHRAGPQLPVRHVEYKRDERAAGTSKYPLLDDDPALARLAHRLLDRAAADGDVAGLGGAVIAVLLFLYTLIARSQGHTVAGWTSTVAIVSAFGAVQLRLRRHPGRVHRADVRAPAGPADLLHRLRLPRRRPGGHGPTDTPLPAVPAERPLRTAVGDEPVRAGGGRGAGG